MRVTTRSGLNVGIKSEYLDLAIAMAVVFFLASLIVSGLNEGIQWLFRIRAKFLWAFLHDLIDKHGAKALPEGTAGVVNLRGNDKRPAVSSAAPGSAAPGGPTSGPVLARRWVGLPPAAPAPQQPAAIGAASDFLHLVAQALNPIDAPQLTGRKSQTQKTAISYVPPTSLAQAFLEVFAEVGRTRVDEGLVRLAGALAAAQDPRPILPEVFGGMGHDEKAALSRALENFVDRFGAAAGDAGAQDAAGHAFANAMSALPGAHAGLAQGDDLAAAVAGFVVAIRTPGADQRDAAARKLSSAVIHTFPNGFARQRIDVALASLEGTPLAPTARRIWEAAEGEIDRFRTGLEQWFESEMTRLSGYYKRSIRVVLVALGLVVALALNIDSLQLARDLWRNPEGRASLVAQADDLVGTKTPASLGTGGAGQAATAAPSPGIVGIQQSCERSKPVTDAASKTPDEAAEAYGKIRNCVNDALNKMSGLNVIDRPIWKPQAWAHDWAKSWAWLLHPLGLLASMLALTLGAPFWFQLLKRLTGLRGDKAPRT